MSGYRELGSDICAAIRKALPSEDQQTLFANVLRLRESGFLGQLGRDVLYGADWLAEIRVAYHLRRADRSDLRSVADDLADVSERPWPEIRAALVSYLEKR